MNRRPLPDRRRGLIVRSIVPWCAAGLLAACADVATAPADDPSGTGVVAADRVPPFRPAPEPLEEVKEVVSPECLQIGKPADGAAPDYPAAAAKVRQEGWVRLRFDLDAGQVVNPRVMASSPAGLFDDAVLAWARQLRYPSGATATSCVMEYEYRLQVRGPADEATAASEPGA
jgi:TonB family protein